MKARAVVIAAAVLVTVAGCATSVSDEQMHARAERIFEQGFSQGNASLRERVAHQDDVQALCSKYAHGAPPEIARKIEQSQQATLHYPASGELMGNWREGEKIAQDGWGGRFTDTGSPNRKNGGNCYACHQIAPHELSYGTLGPSLYQFGKRRGYTDEMRKYAYGKIYNADAFAACTGMPRFGANGILTEQQIKDVVALLMDPESPVNK